MTLVTLLFVSTSYAAWPLGTTFNNAISVDVTEHGFQLISDATLNAVPTDPILIPDIYEYDIGYDPLFNWIEIWEYEFSVTNMWIGMSLDSMDISPSTGELLVSGMASIWVNEDSDPTTISAWAEGLGFLSIGESCDLVIDPFDIYFDTSVSMDVLSDGTVDATIGELVWSTTFSSNELTMSDCGIGDINEFLVWLGIDLIDLFWPVIEPIIDSQIPAFAEELETTLEDLFVLASLEEDIDLLGTQLSFSMRPSDVQITPDGMRIALAADVIVDPSDCLPDGAPTQSQETSFDMPWIGEYPTDISTDPQIAALIDDDFVNNVMLAVYSSGLLCMNIDNSSGSLPIDLSTSLLGFIHPEYATLFAVPAPVSIRLAPGTAIPTVQSGNPDGADLQANQLSLDFYVQLDGRDTRLLGTQLDANVHLDLDYDIKTGLLAIDVPLSGDDIITDVVHNEYLPNEDQEIAAGFSPFIDTLISPLIGTILSDFNFALPAILGVGVTEIELVASGSNSETLGLYVDLGNTPFATDKSAGCGTEEEDSSCEGCSATSLPTNAFIFIGPILFGLVRRRRI